MRGTAKLPQLQPKYWGGEFDEDGELDLISKLRAIVDTEQGGGGTSGRFSVSSRSAGSA